MIDFHTHTFLSDGVLSPAEHIRRAYIAGYKTIGITDHVDFTNIEFVFESIIKSIDMIKGSGWDIKVIPGVEITHVPAKKIEKIVNKARDMKIPLVIVHGETPVEPVEKGTNRAAIESFVDILAHPGLILEDDIKMAAYNKVNLEITARKGHSLTNGHVAKLAMQYNTRLVLDTDSHAPGDFFNQELRMLVLKGAGIDDDKIKIIENNIIDTAKTILERVM